MKSNFFGLYKKLSLIVLFSYVRFSMIWFLFGHFTTDTIPFLDNNVTFSAKHYRFWKLCSDWLVFSINRAGKIHKTWFALSSLKTTLPLPQLASTLILLLISTYWEKDFTVHNNSLLYSVSFTEETARISIRDLSNGLNDFFCNPTYYSVAHY